MAIVPFQSGLSSVGHFDFLESDLPELLGGEVVVFDSIDSFSPDKLIPDTYVHDGYHTILRLATSADLGPFFLSDLNSTHSFPAPGFELTSLFASNASYAGLIDGSGRVAVYGGDGFYSISVSAVDDTTIDNTLRPNTLLYPNASGRLTTTPSSANKAIGYFIEYREKAILHNPSHPIRSLGDMNQGDYIIFYKQSLV